MKRREYLSAVVILLLAAGIASGYDVVLKNGKKIEGSYLKESDSEVLIRDKDGVTLRFRKSTLDLDAMDRANSQLRRVETPEPVPLKESPEVVPVKESPQAKPAPGQSESKAKKVFTNEDLKELPELSYIASEHAQENSEEEAPNLPPDPYSPEIENYWKNRTMEIADRLHQALDDYHALQQECDDAKAALSYYVLNGYWAGRFAPTTDPAQICDQANHAKAEYDRWALRLEEFQDYARKQGALPGWIDPERF